MNKIRTVSPLISEAAYKAAHDTVMSLRVLLGLKESHLKIIADHEGKHARQNALMGVPAEAIYEDIKQGWNVAQDYVINEILRDSGINTQRSDNMTKVTIKNSTPDGSQTFGCIGNGDWFRGNSGTIYVKASSTHAIGIEGVHIGSLLEFGPKDMVRPIKSVELTISY